MELNNKGKSNGMVYVRFLPTVACLRLAGFRYDSVTRDETANRPLFKFWYQRDPEILEIMEQVKKKEYKVEVSAFTVAMSELRNVIYDLTHSERPETIKEFPKHA